MSLQVENLEHNMAKLTIEVPADEFARAMTEAYKKNKNKISVPGFRKGKVPQTMIEKMYGPEVFYEDAANIIIPNAYEKEISEHKEVEVVSQPEIDVTQCKKGEPFIFTAVVALKPGVELGKYKGVKIDKIDREVTDEEIDKEINREREANSRTITVEDRPVKDKDITIIDFEGFVDGEAFEGGKGENYSLTIGSGAFIPGFEEQLIGANKDEEREIKVTFPEDYHAEELKGKDAVFKVKVHEIKEKELPELDDEFASEVSEFDTLAEYREDVKKKLTEKKEQEVTVYAPSSLGDSLQFSKWVFTIDDGTTWYDLSTSPMVSFVIPCDMQLRALYINPVTQPQVEMSARSYDYPYHDEKTNKDTTVDAILFQMNYKLPDGYTFVDAGVRLGDNQGISYYELKEKTISMTAETQAIATGFAVVTSFLGQSINTFDTSASEKFYDKRENNVLDEMSAATLAEYMYESKPVNVEKYEPIYWETKATTKGLCGSINSLAPLRFAQKNNGDHYIYGIGWMRYKDKDGNIQTIYTPALPTTLNGVLANTTGTVTKSGS